MNSRVTCAGLGSSELAAAEEKLANKASHVIEFQTKLPALGHATFNLKKTSGGGLELVESAAEPVVFAPTAAGSVSNEFYSISYDGATGEITSITNKITSATTPLSISWGWYRSSEGGCSGGVTPDGKWQYDLYGCDSQASGAYMFRPNSSTVYPCGAGQPKRELMPLFVTADC